MAVWFRNANPLQVNLRRWSVCTLCSLRFFASKRPKDYSNFPEEYIKKEKEYVEWRNPKRAGYNVGKEIKNRVYNYTVHRPWEYEAKSANPPDTRRQLPKYVVEPISDEDWCFYRGDKVEILVGKDKGKQGIINYLVPERNWVLVEGLNCEYKYAGKTKNYPGMMVKSEKPLIINHEVALIDPSDMKPTETEWRWTEQGEQVRVSVRTGRIIPIPIAAEETNDYKTKSTYTEKLKDTKPEDLEEITYTPSLQTFEMDIMEQLKIKENAIPAKSYWY
uniref:Large ribosomal subunit protein uL24m n=1 Tax=Strigamia maritima TaxID=126957 RepID=T1II11_STRMM